VCWLSLRIPLKNGGVLWWYHNDITRDDYEKKVSGLAANQYTENALRIEHGLPLRIVYPILVKTLIGTMKWEEAIKIFPDYTLPQYPATR